MANKNDNTPIPNFETALQKLSTVVENMESGKLTLEEALKQFEEGVALTRECQQILRDAELRIEALTSPVGSDE